MIADGWQEELDARDAEYEERLQHQMAVHHAELLQERNSRLEIQRLYEAIQIEIKQKTTSFSTQLSQKDIAIQAAESATLKVR